MGWIGVDLDGTLAHYEGFVGPEHIGEPIPLMVQRVKNWLAQGKDVRIFTARIDGAVTPSAVEIAATMPSLGVDKFKDKNLVRACIEAWCERYIGQKLPITNVKDFEMIELWDDRCVRVVANTGVICCNFPSSRVS